MARCPWGRTLIKCLRVFLLVFLHSFPQRIIWPFTTVTVSWGKGNNQNFQGLLDAGSELTLILGDRKKHCGPHFKEGAEIWLTDPRGPWTHPVVHFLGSERVIGIDTFRHWYNPILVPWPVQWGILWLERLNGSHWSWLNPGKIMNQRQFRVSGGIKKWVPSSRAWKVQGGRFLPHLPLTSYMASAEDIWILEND